MLHRKDKCLGPVDTISKTSSSLDRIVGPRCIEKGDREELLTNMGIINLL